MRRPTLLLTILIFGFMPACRAQDQPTFPTDEEIQLLLTQADRAMQQYKPLIDETERRFGDKGAEASAKDRQVLEAVNVAVQALRKKPQAFNSPLGFALFEWLDDSSRNALLCSSAALSQSAALMMQGNTDQANALVHLSQSCMDASTLINTVSENAASLYTRYIKAEENLAAKGFSVSQKCTEALKKMAAEKKQ